MLPRVCVWKRVARSLSSRGAPAWALIPLLFWAFALRARWLSLDLVGLATHVVPDDAFYYFQIARRLTAGQGVTFDGVAPATGLHYTWLALIAPLFHGAPPGAAAPVVSALVLATALFAVAAWALFVIVRRLSGDATLAWAAAAALSVQPWLVRESMNGLETSLALAALLGAVLSLIHYVEAPSGARAWLVSGALVLCFFARSDSLVVLAPATAALLVARRTRAFALRIAAVVTLFVGAATASNWVRTGALLQSSASAVPRLFHSNWARLHPDATPGELRRRSLRFFMNAVDMLVERMGATAVVGALGAAALVVAVCVLQRRRSGPARAARSPSRPDDDAARVTLLVLLGLVIGMGLLVFVHGYVRWLPRPWYFVAAAPIALLVGSGAVLAARLLLPPSRAKLAVRLVTVSFVAIACSDLALQRRDVSARTYPWQEELLLAGQALEREVPPDAAVGAFNSGILGYLSARTVVNLDGIVNEDAARALGEARLLEYMARRDVRFVADYPAMWDAPEFLHATLHLWGPSPAPPRELRTFDVPGVGWPNDEAAVVLGEVVQELGPSP